MYKTGVTQNATWFRDGKIHPTGLIRRDAIEKVTFEWGV